MSDFKSQSDVNLRESLATKRDELRQFRQGTAGSRTRDVKAGRTLRKDIARILTELTARRKVAPTAKTA